MKHLIAASILLFGLTAGATAQITVPGISGSGSAVTMPPPINQPPRQPNAPARLDTFQDKATRCVHYGTSQGVQPGQIGQYTRECANSQ